MVHQKILLEMADPVGQVVELDQVVEHLEQVVVETHLQ
jgi:hypothetical protein|tara:strand:- start:409 stop:522 length:114 start_codon:yes stop_codon:yes gene_type:complete